MKPLIIQRLYITDERYKMLVAKHINDYKLITRVVSGKTYVFLYLNFSTYMPDLKDVVEVLFPQSCHRMGYLSYTDFIKVFNNLLPAEVLGETTTYNTNAESFSGDTAGVTPYLKDKPYGKKFLVLVGCSDTATVTEQSIKVVRGVIDHIDKIKHSYYEVNNNNNEWNWEDYAPEVEEDDDLDPENNTIQQFINDNKELLLVGGAVMLFILIYKIL